MVEKEKDGRQYPEVLPPVPYYVEEDEIDLIELWNVLWKRRFFIGGFTLVCTLAAVIVVLFVLPVTYRSQAVLLPTQASSGGALSSFISSLPINTGGLKGGGSKSDLMVDFLKSRRLQMRLIEKYNLLPVLYESMWDKEARKWKTNDPKKRPTVIRAIQTKILSNFYHVDVDRKTGLITLSWESKDPAFAALMLKRVIAELRHYLNYEYETDAKRERIFVQKQLKKAEKELKKWENQVPTKNITAQEIERERLAAETVYTLLRKQLEMAKIAEAKEVIDFKVLDPPFVPEIRYKPKRRLICAVTLVSSLFLAIFLVFFMEYISNARAKREEKCDSPA